MCAGVKGGVMTAIICPSTPPEFNRYPHSLSLMEEFRPMTQFILGLGRCLEELPLFLFKKAPVVNVSGLNSKKDLQRQWYCINMELYQGRRLCDSRRLYIC